MRNFSPADRKWFWETTTQCTVQVWTARQRAAKEAGCYRVQAEVFKALAAKTNFPKVRASRLRIATSYQRLAEIAEGALEVREHAAQGSERPAPQVRGTVLSNEDRQIAAAALVALSRSLCDVSVVIIRQARERLRRGPAADRSFLV